MRSFKAYVEPAGLAPRTFWLSTARGPLGRRFDETRQSVSHPSTLLELTQAGNEFSTHS